MDKILIIVYVPLIDEKFEIFIPINKKIGTIKKHIIDTINELSENSLSNVNELQLYDKLTNRIYENNVFVKQSGIQNGTEIVIL